MLNCMLISFATHKNRGLKKLVCFILIVIFSACQLISHVMEKCEKLLRVLTEGTNYLINGTILGGRGEVIEHKMCASSFSITLV